MVLGPTTAVSGLLTISQLQRTFSDKLLGNCAGYFFAVVDGLTITARPCVRALETNWSGIRKRPRCGS